MHRFLVLQRAQRSDELEMFMKRRRAHVYGLCKLLDHERTVVLPVNQLDRLSNFVRVGFCNWLSTNLLDISFFYIFPNFWWSFGAGYS